ncbi:forkhead box j1 protein [Plakobranchus ocellatus]|uniref:Forkhead box j1 protein n=1 Tax=Plakobranchus ocellatus TaxID=259542 RepID=A0AAV4D2G2_9GAST|nr:forkhead box j1 protein [Plakobranchus ocellatus]
MVRVQGNGLELESAAEECFLVPGIKHVKLKLPVRYTGNNCGSNSSRPTQLIITGEVNIDNQTMSPSATLARRFQQNWLAKHPGDTYHNGGNLDDSLTSLGWLQNLKVSEITQPRQGSSAGSPGLDNMNSNGGNRRNGIKQENPSSPPPSLLTLQQQHHQVMTSKFDPRLGSGLQVADMAPSMTGSGGSFSSSSSNSSSDAVDYKTNPYVKPPYSYASLICMAMKATRKNKITLSSIYNWITDNFMYYRLTDPSWQNSIRHNLSLNKCFEKVARRKDEPGKGGFWRINPEFGEMAENGVFKKRRGSRDAIIPSPPLKRFKLEDVDDDDDDNDNGHRRRFPLAAGMKSSTREDKLLSNGSLADLSMDDDDDDNSLTLRLRGTGSGGNGQDNGDFVVGGLDFNWTSILNQDIDIGGKTVKTEAILDDPDLQQSPFMAMSPPSSETNSDDLGLDELFSQTDFAMNLPVDFQTNDPLDLTVQGTTIKPPEWWNSEIGLDGTAAASTNNTNDNFHTDIFNNNIPGSGNDHRHNSRLNTPVPPSPESDHGDAMWGEGIALSSSGHHFDLDNLFEFDNIPSPQL